MSTTFNPKRKKRARTHGFLQRMRVSGGRNVLSRRRNKKRQRISV